MTATQLQYMQDRLYKNNIKQFGFGNGIVF